MIPNFSATFRSLLPASPITKAVDEARRMAQQHREAGGAVAGGRDGNAESGFVIPPNIEPAETLNAIQAKLRGSSGAGRDQGASAAVAIKRDAGRLVVAAECVKLVGGGDYDRGIRLLKRLIAEIRARRVLMRSGDFQGRRRV